MQWMKGLVIAMTMTAGVQGAMAAVTKSEFGKLPDGRAVQVYTLKNADLEVHIATYGARIVSLKTRDRDGKIADVVVWDGDPLETTSFPRAVFIDGQEVPPISRQTELRDRYMQRLKLGPYAK